LGCFWTVQNDTRDHIVSITKHIGFNMDFLTDGSLMGKRPPSISGETPSIWTRCLPSLGSIKHLPLLDGKVLKNYRNRTRKSTPSKGGMHGNMTQNDANFLTTLALLFCSNLRYFQ
jgi:hypothetical protein